MVRQLGCRTWSVSLSAADLHWPELLTLIERQRGQLLSENNVHQLSWEQKCEITNGPTRESTHTNVLYAIDLFLFYRTDYTDSRTMLNGCTGKCVRLSRPLVGF